MAVPFKATLSQAGKISTKNFTKNKTHHINRLLMQKRLCTHIFKSKLTLGSVQTAIINMIKVTDSFNKKELLHGLRLFKSGSDQDL